MTKRSKTAKQPAAVKPKVDPAACFDVASDMEDDVCAVRYLARALFMMAHGLPDKDCSAFQTIAVEIGRRGDLIEEQRGQLFHALHPAKFGAQT